MSSGGRSISAGTAIRRLGLLPLALFAFSLLVNPVSAAELLSPSGAFCPTGTKGGECQTVGRIAVNNTGAGGVPAGTVYVAEADNNRVERFSPNGAFERAWGFNVSGRDEKQTVSLAGVSSGNFTLTFGANTTAPITVTLNGSGKVTAPSAATLQTAIAGLASVGAGNVSVTATLGNGEGQYVVRFIGALSGTDVQQLISNGTNLVGTSPSISVTTTETGSGGSGTGFEICTIAANCQDGTTTLTTANGGQLKEPQGIDVNQATGNVYVIDNGNRRVEEFDPNGNFIRAWGAGVATGVATFETCSTEAGCRQAAAAGTNGGQFGANPRSLKIDPSGNVWVADSANRRFEKFDSAGNFIAVYGFNVNNGGALESCTSTVAGVCKAATAGTGLGQFNTAGSAVPFFFDFDSAGNLYPNNGGNQRIEKCNFSGPISCSAFYSNSNLQNNSAMLALPGNHFLVTVSEGGELLLRELDSVGVPVQTSLTGAGFTSVIAGLARSSSTSRIYLTSNVSSLANVVILAEGAPPPPMMTIDPIETHTDSTATFKGTIDPVGSTISSCSFQLSTDKVSWTSISVPNCSSLAPGGGTQQVSINATGLTPNTKYFVRLAVNRLFIGGTAFSAPVSFATDAVAPAVSNVGGINPSDISARLAGTVNPRNSGTVGYIFEYGTTPALGLATPPVAIPNGSAPVVVSQVVQGLSPGATYYLRLKATNTVGSTFSTFATFTTRALPPQPSERKYEMVSPVEKNGGGALSGNEALAVVAYDGQAIGYCGTSLFGEPPAPQSLACGGNYASWRSPDGWATESATPAFCSVAFNGPNPSVGASQAISFSRNLDLAVISQPENPSCAIPRLDPQAPLPGINLYRENLGSAAFDYQLLAPEQPFSATFTSGQTKFRALGLAGYYYGGASDDFSHIIYTSTGAQTLDAAPPANNLEQLFEWDEGTLRLVSKDLAGNAFTTSSTVPLDSVNGVSTGGERVFFQNPSTTLVGETCAGASCELYLREGGTTTFDVSQSECHSACGSSAADRFFYATPDGSKAFFASDAKLTDDDNSSGSFDPTSKINADLYMFTKGPGNPASEPANLTLLSKDEEPSDGTNADVQGITGISDSGDTVFFVANKQIVAGASTATGPKLYRWRWNGGSPAVDCLVTLAAGDSANWDANGTAGGFKRLRRVTPDGQYLLIKTALSLSPAADTDSDADFYRWSQVDGWVCVSCQMPGTPSAGNVSGAEINPLSAERQISMSDDGEHIFFTTPDALVPQDENGSFNDVYEWHEGALSLVSTGTEPSNMVRLFGVSHTGEDVFFETEQPLVGWDVDSASDIYDYRFHGGLPEPAVSPPPCEGEACRGVSSTAPPSTGPGSEGFEAPEPSTGTSAENPCKKGFVRRGGKCVKSHAKKAHHKRGAGKHRHRSTQKGR